MMIKQIIKYHLTLTIFEFITAFIICIIALAVIEYYESKDTYTKFGPEPIEYIESKTFNRDAGKLLSMYVLLMLWVNMFCCVSG